MSDETEQAVLTVLIGTRNRLTLLQQCLDAVRATVKVPCQVIVIDAGSTDGTLEYLNAQSDIRVVRDTEPIGQAPSLNRVLARVATPYVCWLSDDNLVQPGALDLACQLLDTIPPVGMVALKVKDMQGPHSNLPYIGGIWPTGVLTCNQGVLRTELFRRLGYFDEQLRDYGIDADLTVRVLLAGYRVVMTKQTAICHYRNYEQFPGAIESAERAHRQARAMTLYCDKYKDLIPRRRSELPREFAARSAHTGLVYGLRLARKSGVRIESILGYTVKDWQNVLSGRYISKLDLWHYRKQPFYLVQEKRQ